MYSPISLDYFLNMEVAKGGPSKQVLNPNGNLKTVRDFVEYWRTTKKPLLTPETWQYYNCMIAGFRHNVANHHDLGWENVTEEYYSSLEPMSDGEIEEYLQNNPVEFDNGFMKHSYHRGFAMIGRLIRGEKYIPFYMETEKIFNKAWVNDNKIRIEPPTSKLKHLSKLDEMGISRDDYCLCQSSILTAMGIRDNDDLDIIISSKLRKQNISFPQGIDVFDVNITKFDYFGANGDDDILENFCITIDGYKFIEPRFYFARKNISNIQRDVYDWDGIREFFKRESHKGYPFNFEFYKWGLPEFSERVKVEDLDFEQLQTIKDKYDRVVDGIHMGRVVYKGDGYFVKVFHPEYCRLHNFRDALSSGFLNGLTPSLTHLIESDNGDVIGYITLSGKHPNVIPNSLINTVARNCKKRNMVFYDLVPINVVKDDYYGQWGLIDLESVYHTSNLSDMETHKAEMKPNNLLEIIDKI
jgi:hypothetical protein